MNLTALPGVIIDGKYRIEQQLGQGGMGAVFVATHLGTTRTVAVKVIVPQLAAQDEFLLRFQREAEAAGRLRHPNVVNVTDFGFTTIDGGASQLAYLVMEFLDGETLAGFLKKNPRPPVDMILDIIDQVALGLDAAHHAGIVHRDLKPDNVWLESNRRGGYNIKVLDFGIAKLNNPTAAVNQQIPQPVAATVITAVSSSPELETQVMAASLGVGMAAGAEKSEADTVVTSPGMSSQAGSLRFTASSLQTTVGSVLGTPAFMAPEQCRGAAVDHQADIYSLAVIAYQLFCGRLPFEAKSLRDLLDQQINATPPAPRQLDKTIASGVSSAILEGLAKDPARRQQSAGTFAAQIRAGAVGETTFLASGKIFANTYLACFAPILIFCFGSLIAFQAVMLSLAGAIAKTKVVPVGALLAAFHLIGFAAHVFASQAYKAAATMVFEEAAAVGYFRSNLRSIAARLFRGLAPMMGMYFATAIRLSWNSFLESALWPVVWVSEGLSGAAARQRARLLAATQPAATLALMARQYALVLTANLASPTLIVAVSGSYDEYATFLFTRRSFSWFLIVYPVMLSAILLSFGPAFDFLYRSARLCLGERVEWSLPTDRRGRRSATASSVRVSTILWCMPAVLMAGVLIFRAIPSNASDSQLLDAASDGRRAAVLRAIDAGSPVDTRDSRERTPLMDAATHGDLEAVRQLLARGAKVNARGNSGSTALMIALLNGHPDIAALLIEHQADVNTANIEGRTALMISAMRGDAVTCRLLLLRGADPARRDDHGKTALDYARGEGANEVIALF